MKQRIFVGIFLPKLLQDKITIWCKNHQGFNVRWISKENLHLTLVPPWYEENIKNKISKIKNTNKISKKITINFTQISLGPNSRAPRLIWVTGNTPPDLTDLSIALHKTLNQPSPKRKFLTHLTIARIKKYQAISQNMKNFKEVVNWNFEVTDFSLIESKLTPSGACYSEIDKFPLKY